MTAKANITQFVPEDLQDADNMAVKLNTLLRAVNSLMEHGVSRSDNMRSVEHTVTLRMSDTARVFPFGLGWPWPNEPPRHGACTWFALGSEGGAFYGPPAPLWVYDGTRIIVLGIVCNLEREKPYQFRFVFEA